MTLWEEMEKWLLTNDDVDFTFNVHYLAEAMGVSTFKASRMIQSYLNAQTTSKSKTLYVLRREGRTASATWHVGVRVGDARAIHIQASDDFLRRFERYVQPTYQRISARNPRAVKVAERLGAAIEANLLVLAALAEE